jgi:hypothetical protein
VGSFPDSSVRGQPKLLALKAEMAEVMAVVREEAAAKAPIEELVWGTPRNGLKLGLCRTEANADGKARLLVALDNVGTDDLVLNLGEMLGFGKKQVPHAVRLIFTDSEGKKRTLLRSSGKIDEKLGALVIPLVVPLPAGGRYMISCDLADYFDAKDVEATLTPGRYRAKAEFVGRGVAKEYVGTVNSYLAYVPYWTGTIQSDECQVTLPAKPAK